MYQTEVKCLLCKINEYSGYYWTDPLFNDLFDDFVKYIDIRMILGGFGRQQNTGIQ